jgi:hypothetical protein
MGTGWTSKGCLIGLLWVLALTPACNRLGAAGDAQTASGSDRKIPFHSDQSAGNAVQSIPPAEAKDSIPFRSAHPRILPSGTLLTVRLEQPLNSSSVHAGDVFTAVVAEPVTVDSEALVSRGTAVTGAIESALASSEQGGAGYIRLILYAITIDGKQIPLQTSSLFAQGISQPSGRKSRGEAAPTGIQLPPGRRLTFRLTVPASLDGQSSVANGQYPGPNTD